MGMQEVSGAAVFPNIVFTPGGPRPDCRGLGGRCASDGQPGKASSHDRGRQQGDHARSERRLYTPRDDSGTALLYGLLPAVIGGILLGMMADASAGIRLLVGPLAITLGAAPLVALLPMFVAWWGLTIVMKAGLVGVVAGFPVMNAVMVAAGEKSRTVAILHGLRLGVVLGVSALIVAEFVAGSRGVGFVIMSSASMFDTTATLAGTVLVTVRPSRWRRCCRRSKPRLGIEAAAAFGRRRA